LSRSIPDQCRRQAGWCVSLGSPLYGDLLARCADAYEKGGALRTLLQPHENDSESSALPLRLMGSVHRLVLEAKANELARFYPSVGGNVDFGGAWIAFASTVEQHASSLRQLINNPVQTNDVGRSGSLLGGFGVIAERTRLPLRLLEIGASAGLNLCWDQYRYDWPTGGWGNVSSAVRLEGVFVGEVPFIPPAIKVIERAACDLSPIEIRNDTGKLTLLSYIWPDQQDRINRLKAAISMAGAVPYVVEKAHGGDWLPKRLEKFFDRATTVVFHSLVWQYISESERESIARTIEEAGARASAHAPLAWLRLEPNNKRFEIRLRLYPGFEEHLLATTGPHAPSVRWSLSVRTP